MYLYIIKCSKMRKLIIRKGVFFLYRLKRTLALVMVGIMTTLSFVSCGSKEDKSEESGNFNNDIVETKSPEDITGEIKDSLDNENKEDVPPVATPIPTPIPEIKPTSVDMLAVGDNLFHMGIVDSGRNEDGTYNYDHLYKHISDDITAADIAAVNQETVFAPEGSKPSGYPRFGAPNEGAQALVNAGFDIIQQASNHTNDRGEKGIRHTIELWKGFKNITVLGIHESEEDYHKITVVKKNNIKIAMLNYTYGLNGINLASDKGYLVDLLDNEEKVYEDIKKAKEIADCVIVYVHWGSEYTHKPTSYEREWAKRFANAGVTAVVGSHPHVIQPVEWVEGKEGNKTLVYYSLGNFVSRQIEAPRVLGGMAKFTLTKDKDGTRITKASVVPVVMHYARYPDKTFTVYRLDKYTQDLAQAHGIKYFATHGKFTLEKTKKLAIDVFGSDSEAFYDITSQASPENEGAQDVITETAA